MFVSMFLFSFSLSPLFVSFSLQFSQLYLCSCTHSLALAPLLPSTEKKYHHLLLTSPLWATSALMDTRKWKKRDKIYSYVRDELFWCMISLCHRRRFRSWSRLKSVLHMCVVVEKCFAIVLSFFTSCAPPTKNQESEREEEVSRMEYIAKVAFNSN